MTSVFTRIIDGELPGRFVWRDEIAVAFLSINPITTGHCLVVPRLEVDHWLDLDPATWTHVAEVAHKVGTGIQQAFAPRRVGQMIAGFEVPHVHVHVLPIASERDLDFARAATDPDAGGLDDAQRRIVAALTDLGHDEAAQ